jgi:hypothetical protein
MRRKAYSSNSDTGSSSGLVIVLFMTINLPDFNIAINVKFKEQQICE